MLRTVIILLLLLACGLHSRAQLCPGGGVNFNSAITFDPAWIYGCTTGTSCNGGVNFDNRIACEPVTSLDACAPAPSCGIIPQTASDIWFKFYASYPNATLACVQNTSLVIGIQAFQGGTCGGLTQLGCALAGGPSSGVQLPLTGLVPGQLYYFRIFGSSHANPQRTGLYCFCGTQGLSSIILPINLESLKAVTSGQQIALSFDKPEQDDDGGYDIEFSTDGTQFKSIYRFARQDMNVSDKKIEYKHVPQTTGTLYYRLKRTQPNGQHHYSSITTATLQAKDMHIVFDAGSKAISVYVDNKTTVAIRDLSGRLVQTATLSAGLRRISTSAMTNGIYILHSDQDSRVHKFLVRN